MQVIFEIVFAVVGYSAAINWDGPIELKIVMVIVITRVCVGYGELSAIERQLESAQTLLLKQIAINQMLILEVRESVRSLQNADNSSGVAADFSRVDEEQLEDFEREFDLGLREAQEHRKALQLIPNQLTVAAIAGALFQMALLLGIGWGIAELL